MSVSIETKKNFLGQFASFCAICKEKIIHEDKEDCHEICPYGNIAQLVVEKDENGEVVEEIDYEFKNNEMNLVLLCNEHRSVLSQMNILKKISLKEDARELNEDKISLVDQSLVKYQKYPLMFSDILYLNISRLSSFILAYGHKIDVRRYDDHKSIYLQEWVQEEIVSRFDKLFSSFIIDAILLNKIKSINEDYIGELVYFEKLDFFSKNIGVVVKREEEFSHIEFNHENGWKVVLYINQNWITTSEAFSEFSSSKLNQLNGFFTVTNVDHNTNTIYGTPFVLALPK